MVHVSYITGPTVSSQTDRCVSLPELLNTTESQNTWKRDSDSYLNEEKAVLGFKNVNYEEYFR